jgi:transposase
MDSTPNTSLEAPMDVARHYQRLLGLEEPWIVSSLVENIALRRIDLNLCHAPNTRFPCPHCQQQCPVHDHAPERCWRHLDALNFSTFLTAQPPRIRCQKHGVVSVSLPWADFSSRWTLDLEFRVIDTLKACSSIQAAAKLLNMSWSTIQSIMASAVARGLDRRDLEGLQFLGLDEKSFLRGQSYVSVCNDLKGRRVLEVSPGRTAVEAAEALKVVPLKQRTEIEAVAIDLSAACAKAVTLIFPKAAQVIDRFHVSALLNKMVHGVRRAEHLRLMAEGNEILKDTSRLWLWGPENMPPKMREEFAKVAALNLHTSKAWLVKENFALFWEQADQAQALRFFEQWEKQALQLKYPQVTAMAKTLRKYLPGLLAYQLYRITNAISEGFNSKIQALKAAARGFRNVANYRIRILFFCGKLDLGHSSPA